MRIIKCGLFKPCAAIFAAFIATMNPAFCQSGPPPLPPILLDDWILAQPDWLDIFRDAPPGFANLNTAPGWCHAGTALSVDTNCPAFLNLSVMDEGEPNISLDSGTISLWFQANWSSTTDGGNGPTNWATMFSVGNWTSNAAQSAWTIAISPSGTNMLMEAQSSGSNQVVFDVPIDFDAGDWHSITVTYSSSSCCVYMEGQLVTNAGPINYFPSESDCTNYGIFVGSLSTNGECQAHGQFQDLRTYDGPLSADMIAQDYANTSVIILNWGGSLPSSGGFHPDDEPPTPEGGTNSGSGGGGGSPDIPQNPGTNLWLIISLQSNSVLVTLTNTVAGFPYLLLAATNLKGPWLTNQSLLATTNTAVAAPIPLGNTNAVFFIAKQAVPGTLRWSVFLGGDGDAFGRLSASPAIGPDGTVYIASGSITNSMLFAIDPLSGKIKWSNNIFIPNESSPQTPELTGSATLGINGMIYIGSDDGNLYSFNPSGTRNWFRNMGNYVAVYSTPAIGSNGTIYVTTDETEADRANSPITGLLSINTNGTTNWMFVPQDPFYGNTGDVDSSPAIGPDGTVYFLAEGHRLYAVSASGNLKWFMPLPGDMEPDSSPAIGSDGTIYVGSNSRYLYAVNSDGSLKWVFNVYLVDFHNALIQASPTIGRDGVIYVGTGDFNDAYGDNPGNLYAINPDGSTNWVFTTATAATMSAPAIGADGTVYVACADNKLYAVTNGSQAWAFETEGPIVSSPAIGADGTVYVGSGDGFLYAIFGSTPLATNAPWPMFHQNPTHTGRSPAPPTSGEECDSAFVYDGTNDGMGDFTFSIVGTAGSVWNVYASTNLTNWTKVGTNLTLVTNVDSFNGNATFTNTNVAGFSQRFYQLSNSTCTSRVIGFVNLNIVPGTNLIANQLCQGDDGVLEDGSQNWPMNTLSALFLDSWDYHQDPTQIMKWNGASFDVAAYDDFNRPEWRPYGSGDMTMLPGSSVLVNNETGSSFTASFVGLVRGQQVFQIQTHTNYLSATVPMAGAITNITGYVPHNGDIIQLFNTNTQAFQSYTNNGSAWLPTNPPVVGVGKGFVLITTNAYRWTNTWEH